MDTNEKLRVLLQHWKEHNVGHRQEFDKWQKLMVEENNPELAEILSETLKKVDEITTLLEKAQDATGGPAEHTHHHHH